MLLICLHSFLPVFLHSAAAVSSAYLYHLPAGHLFATFLLSNQHHNEVLFTLNLLPADEPTYLLPYLCLPVIVLVRLPASYLPSISSYLHLTCYLHSSHTHELTYLFIYLPTLAPTTTCSPANHLASISTNPHIYLQRATYIVHIPTSLPSCSFTFPPMLPPLPTSPFPLTTTNLLSSLPATTLHKVPACLHTFSHLGG